MAARTGTLHRACIALLAALAISGCSRSATPPRDGRGGTRVVASFEGEVDAASGRITLRDLPPEAALLTGALVEIPVVQDGVPGVGPADTVELVTERAADSKEPCGGWPGFEGDIRLRSFYPGYQLQNAYVEVVWMSQSVREACNSAPPVPGVSDQFGLFSYGTLTEAGTPADSALATWRFRVPDQTAFSFRAHVVADLVDLLPPGTTADHPGGLINAARPVTLTCADAGSGCAATYFTTDGSEPTAASPRYEAPILVDRSLTLRWFSVDVAGNAEAPRSAEWVLDTVAPTVAAVSPRRQQGSVPVSTPVRLDFTEPMDPATVAAAITLTGPSGAVGGWAAQVDADTWTFTPYSALQAGASYLVQVGAGALDLAGNGAVPFASRFNTASSVPPWKVSGPGSANYLSWGIAWDAAGNGLAVFGTNSWASRGGRLLYAYYDAGTGTWGAEQPLYTDGSIGVVTIPARVVSNGSTFLVAWQELSGQTRAVRFSGGVPGTVKVLAPNGNLTTSSPPTFDLAANGSAYAALFVDASELKAWTHDGTDWDPLGPTTVSSTYVSEDPVIARRGASWAVAWHENNNSTHAIWTGRYDSGTRTWTTAALAGTSGTAYQMPPVIASNGSTVVVGWGTNTGPVMAAMDTGAGFGTSTQLSYGAGAGDGAKALSAAANGSLFAIVWRALPMVGNLSGYGSLYDGAAWRSAASLESKTGEVRNAVVAPSGPGFAAALEIADSNTAGAPYGVWLNQSTASAWSSSSLVAAESLPASAAHAVVAARGGGAVLAWDQDDGARHQVRVVPWDGASFGTTSSIVNPGQDGGCGAVRLASNGAGEVLAVWAQDDRGAPAVFASLRSGGAWGAPVRISLEADAPAVASNGADFMIAFRRRTAAGGIGVAPFSAPASVTWFDAGGQGAPAPSVASDGSGFMVAWRYGTGGTQAAFYTGTSWSAAQSVNASGAYAPLAAGHPGEYMVAWRTYSPGYGVAARRATAPVPSGPWALDAAPASFASGTIAPTSNLEIAATATAFGLAWWNSSLPSAGGGQAAIFTGGGWQAQGNTGPIPPYCTLAQLGASASTFLAVATCTDGLHAIRWSGSWSAPFSISADRATALAVSSDGQDFKVAALQADGAGSSLFEIDVDAAGTSWPKQLVASGITPAVAPIQPVLSATFDGVQHVGAWIQQGSDPALDVVRARAGY